MDLHANWNYPTSVRFGAGRIAELSEAVRAVRVAAALMIVSGLALIRLQ